MKNAGSPAAKPEHDASEQGTQGGCPPSSAQPVWLALRTLPPQGNAAAAPTWLSASEHRRFSRLSAPRRCVQFLTARRLLWELLAAVHGGDPWRDWTLGAADDGLLHVERAPAGAPEALWLAVSHSADQVACAAAPFAIGIDIDLPRPPPQPRHPGRGHLQHR